MTPADRDPRRFPGGRIPDLDLEDAYRQQRPRLFNYFRRCGLRRETSEDLTQGVFLVLMENPGRFDPSRGAFEVFVFGIARNLRRAWTRRRRPEAQGPERSAPAASEEVVMVRAAVGTLPEAQREALILREFHGFDYREIAGIQRVELGTVRSRLARAREALRKVLGDNAEPGLEVRR